MPLLFRELKANLKGLIVWSLSAVFFIIAGMGKFEGLTSDEMNLNSFAAKMPKAMQFLFGGGQFDLSTVSGFYGVMFSYMLLLGAIYAVTLGSGILIKEERDKTAEFLVVKPIPRYRIILEKLIAVVAMQFFFNLVIGAASIITLDGLEKGNDLAGRLWRLMIALFLVQMIFATLGAAMAAIGKDHHAAAHRSIWILLAVYLLSIMINIADPSDVMNILKALTPFLYFDTAALIGGAALPLVPVLGSVLLITLFTAATFVFYQKRDMTL